MYDVKERGSNRYIASYGDYLEAVGAADRWVEKNPDSVAVVTVCLHRAFGTEVVGHG